MLPNCIVNGVAKSGTTSIYHYLKAHHQVFMSERKELNFYSHGKLSRSQSNKNQPPVSTLEEYQSYFAGSKGYLVRGEASPSYFSTPGAARHIKKDIPDVKLITTLRNPSERAYSGYLMNLRGNSITPNEPNPFSKDKHWVKMGLYHERLKEYYNTFDRTRIKIVLLEDMKSDKERVLLDIFDYLDIDNQYEFKSETTTHNRAFVPKNHFIHNLLNNNSFVKKVIRPAIPKKVKKLGKKLEEMNHSAPEKMPDEVREHLIKLYDDDISKVEDLIGRDLQCWRQ